MRNWDKDIKKGQSAEGVVMRLLSRLGFSVHRLEDKADWHRGDLLVPQLGYVEVKGDYTNNGNLFIEVDVAGRPGWLYSSRADYLAYYSQSMRKVYLFRMAYLQRHLTEHWAVYRSNQKTVKTQRGDSVWQASGVPIPLEALLGEIPHKVFEVVNEDLVS